MFHFIWLIGDAIADMALVEWLVRRYKKPSIPSTQTPSLRELEEKIEMKEGKKGLWWYIATWFGSGLSPVASGTAGSLAALPFAYVIQTYLGNIALFIASVAIFFIGWWASNEYLRHNPENKDPGQIVVDEVAGQWLVLCLFPPAIGAYLIGFLLFRFFDVIKIWPASWADQKVGGGLGVMLDDIFAALQAIVLLAVIMFIVYIFVGGA